MIFLKLMRFGRRRRRWSSAPYVIPVVEGEDGGLCMLYTDYIANDPTHNKVVFRRRFKINRNMFMTIVMAVRIGSSCEPKIRSIPAIRGNRTQRSKTQVCITSQNFKLETTTHTKIRKTRNLSCLLPRCLRRNCRRRFHHLLPQCFKRNGTQENTSERQSYSLSGEILLLVI
jgi:hypothetical protein